MDVERLNVLAGTTSPLLAWQLALSVDDPRHGVSVYCHHRIGSSSIWGFACGLHSSDGRLLLCRKMDCLRRIGNQ